jgi:hypothetical protein
MRDAPPAKASVGAQLVLAPTPSVHCDYRAFCPPGQPIPRNFKLGVEVAEGWEVNLNPVWV